MCVFIVSSYYLRTNLQARISLETLRTYIHKSKMQNNNANLFQSDMRLWCKSIKRVWLALLHCQPSFYANPARDALKTTPHRDSMSITVQKHKSTRHEILKADIRSTGVGSRKTPWTSISHWFMQIYHIFNSKSKSSMHENPYFGHWTSSH